MLSAVEALKELQAGNARFVAGLKGDAQTQHQSRKPELRETQEPIAIILGCSDARVPAEIVFDQALGELFVIRVAGNIVASSQVGSVEFAASAFGTRLVVVLGHTQCGAIQSTISELQQPSENQSKNLRSIVDRVQPSVETLLATDLKDDYDELVRQSVRANVRVSVNHLRNGSAVLESLIASDGLRIIGAEYAIETGQVDFFDGTGL